MFTRLFLTLFCLIHCIAGYTQVQQRWVFVKGGAYVLGEKGNTVNPVHKVRINSFYISNIEVTNADFEKFVIATKYITTAERLKNASVFEPGLKEFKWIKDTTAYWRYPNGKSRGGIEDKMNHPVTTISYNDVEAYCKWAKLRLPTLDEWEVASRCGSKQKYFWGTDENIVIKYANVWHGKNHLTADTIDSYLYTSPVGSFKPNALGLYDMYGNVFEFCSGFLPTDRTKTVAHARGGSWWCSASACGFYNSVDIGSVNRNASFSNQGFRVVKRATLSSN